MPRKRKIKTGRREQYVIDSETGEMTTSIYDGDHIVRKEQIEHYLKYDDKFYSGKEFVKVFPRVIPLLAKKLTAPELNFLFLVIPYVSYNDNILKCDNKILNMKMLSEIVNTYSYNNIRKIIPSLISKDVMKQHKMEVNDINEKCYIINPYIAGKGRSINRKVIELFENSDWNGLE